MESVRLANLDQNRDVKSELQWRAVASKIVLSEGRKPRCS